ncbi:MAG: hypothetical protein A2946_01135 [Candidatus Liptonbacteria bacterium RIFCSPLOWO2_01_FULL_53_13]|uniref:Dipeptidylpeptidase IV N-terminal domain-containing protein n=1 Tax=Candidatus Liptonbacteria bacterium RIFCSPLOWO2_01_FULL_53_13 TaxID=1798651 RepID=A0A1G2CMA2_9BACT|nr:MAG: hypothetical protein A2946_01135 [Candidatus Liptonbacteria bacterium RIFCSPLOWO2_01_FULL_53_13]
MKRLLYALGILALVAIVIFIGYFFRYRAEVPPGTETGGLGTGGGLPQTAPLAPGAQPPGGGQSGTTQGETGGAPGTSLGTGRRLTLVSDKEVSSFSVDKDGAVYLIQPDGQIVKVANGKQEVVSAAPIASLLSSAFSSDSKKVVATFLAGGLPQSSVFDMDAKVWQSLPANAEQPLWAPTGQTIAYLHGATDGKKEIVTQDLKNAKAKSQALASFAMEDVALSWPSSDIIIIASKSSARIAGAILSFNVKKKTISFLANDERGLMSAWNASSTKGLVFAANRNARGGGLTIRDASGNIQNQLALLTLPSKCVFGIEAIKQEVETSTSTTATTSSKAKSAPKIELLEVLYCGIPRDAGLLLSQELPDSYQKRALYTIDDIYRIDLKDGFVEVLWAADDMWIDADAPKVANGKLYLLNRYDKKLYELKLAQ